MKSIVMSLYRDDILDHYRHPQNFGKPDTFTHSFEQSNQSCGDRQSVYLNIENEIIKDARFEGTGCAISIAATSLLSEMIRGTSIHKLQSLGEQDIRTFLSSEIAPGRMNCTMLGLRSFQEALKQGPRVVEMKGIASNVGSCPVVKDSNLGEIAGKYPQAARVFTEYGLHCVGCFASSFDSVEAGASIHGMGSEEIEDMIKRANEEIALHPEETLNSLPG